MSIRYKISRLLFKLWVYILNNIYININKYVFESDKLYVVYTPIASNEVFICKSGQHALELYNQLNKLNLLLNRPMIKVIYGEAAFVFKHKMLKVMDISFTWDASEKERREIFSKIADIPLQIN